MIVHGGSISYYTTQRVGELDPSWINNMTHILATQRDSNKTHNMQIFYLYCKSGKPIDRIMSTYLSRYRKNIFIECNDLKSYLQNKPECENV